MPCITSGHRGGAGRLSDGQRAYQAELRRGREDLPPIWMVTDFITLGCPLSKGDVLLAKDNHDFGIRKRQRELPTCPPWLEKNDAKKQAFPVFLSNRRNGPYSTPRCYIRTGCLDQRLFRKFFDRL